MIKVLIADDQELIRESLGIILSSFEDIEVVASASDGEEVLDKLKTRRRNTLCFLPRRLL